MKKLWVVLLAFSIFGILSWVPVDKYQKAYMDEFHRIKAKPQKRIDTSYKYVEYIEDGGEPNSVQVQPEPAHINYESGPRRDNNSRHRKPYFIRDKYNPNILHPYRG